MSFGSAAVWRAVDETRQRQLLRVAEREVGDAGIEMVALPVAASDPLEYVRDAGQHAVHPRLGDGHRLPSSSARTYSSSTLPFGNVRVPVSRNASGASREANNDLPLPSAIGAMRKR